MLKSTSKYFLFSLFLILLVFINVVRADEQVAPNIVVLDIDKVERSSEAWNYLIQHVNNLRLSFQKNVKYQEDELRRRGEELEIQQDSLAEEKLKKLLNKFRADRLKLKNDTKQKKNELDYVYSLGRKQIRTVLNKILVQYAKENKIDMILNSGGNTGIVHYVNVQKFDISKKVLQLLNAKIQKLDLAVVNNE